MNHISLAANGIKGPLRQQLTELLTEAQQLKQLLGDRAKPVPPLLAAKLLLDGDRLVTRLAKHRRSIEAARNSKNRPR